MNKNYEPVSEVEDFFEEEKKNLDLGILFNEADFELSEEQQNLAVTLIDSKEPLLDIARQCFMNSSLDKRSDEFDRVRRFIAKIKRGTPSTVLTPEQQEFIHNNADKLRPMDLAKALFPKSKIKPLSKEVKDITKYLDIIGLNKFSMDEENGIKDYSPPQADSKIVEKINKSNQNAEFRHEFLTALEERCVKALRGYLRNSRFLSTINGIKKSDERNLFEMSFVHSVYDKPDLNSEELNMCITMCYHYVLEKQIKEQLEVLNEQLMSQAEESDGAVKMALTEAYGKKSSELGECVKRAKSLQEALSGSRSKRMQNQADMNKSLTSLVEAWKEEKERKKLILIAKARELKVEDEMSRLESEEEALVRIMGISQQEISNGL